MLDRMSDPTLSHQFLSQDFRTWPTTKIDIVLKNTEKKGHCVGWNYLKNSEQDKNAKAAIKVLRQSPEKGQMIERGKTGRKATDSRQNSPKGVGKRISPPPFFGKAFALCSCSGTAADLPQSARCFAQIVQACSAPSVKSARQVRFHRCCRLRRPFRLQAGRPLFRRPRPDPSLSHRQAHRKAPWSRAGA